MAAQQLFSKEVIKLIVLPMSNEVVAFNHEVVVTGHHSSPICSGKSYVPKTGRYWGATSGSKSR